jgi:hypothetical protein
MLIYRSILLIIKYALDNRFSENQNIHVMCKIFAENRPFYGMMWKNMVQPDRSQVITRRMRFPCWITGTLYNML